LGVLTRSGELFAFVSMRRSVIFSPQLAALSGIARRWDSPASETPMGFPSVRAAGHTAGTRSDTMIVLKLSTLTDFLSLCRDTAGVLGIAGVGVSWELKLTFPKVTGGMMLAC
jgi:hypothetical protein